MSLPLALVGFVTTVVGLVVSLVLSLTVVGLFVLVPVFALVAGLARLEQRRALWLLGPTAGERPATRGGSRPGPIQRLKDGRNWRCASFLLLNLPLSALTFGVVAALVVFLVRAVTYPFLAWGDESYYTQAWGGPTYLGAVAVHSGPGVLVLLLGPALIRALTGLHARLARNLVGDDRPVRGHVNAPEPSTTRAVR
jgi:hypothetical protein